MTNIIRYIFTLALVAGVYTETGTWTAIAVLLIALNIELENVHR